MIEDSIWNGLAVLGTITLLIVIFDICKKLVKKVSQYKIVKK